MENQFLTLRNWTFEVLDAIKKDIKADHLPKDPELYRTYFGNRPQNRLKTEEIFAAYEAELLKGNEELSAWIVNRWVFKHGELYQHFAERLSEINPDFDELKQLTEEESLRVLEGAAETYGAIPTFLFSFLNGVVFPKAILDRLQQDAEEERQKVQTAAALRAEEATLEQMKAAHQREVNRLNDRIAGVQKKYDKDTAMLKDQIKRLQQRLSR